MNNDGHDDQPTECFQTPAAYNDNNFMGVLLGCKVRALKGVSEGSLIRESWGALCFRCGHHTVVWWMCFLGGFRESREVLRFPDVEKLQVIWSKASRSSSHVINDGSWLMVDMMMKCGQ